MSSASDPHSILNRNPEAGRFQVPPPKAKITRYFPGKAPDWQQDNDSNSEDDVFPGEPDLKSLGGTSITSDKLNKRLAALEEKVGIEKKFEERFIVRSEKISNPKISTSINNTSDSTKETQIHNTQPKKKQENEIQMKKIKVDEKVVQVVSGMEDEDRRKALKARLLAKEDSSKEMIPDNNNTPNDKTDVNDKKKGNEKMEKENELKNDEEDDLMEDEVEDIIEEYEEENGLINILKPIYVRKDERNGINDKQVLEELALEEERKKAQERKKIEAKILVSEAVKRTHDEDEDAEKSNSEQGLPEDNDEIEQDQELEQWKIRELKRIKKEREERQKREKEFAEIARRRNLTDEERKAEDLKLGSDDTEKGEKSHYRFLQKYYHKGAFYMDDEDPILKRDYNIAVGEDLFDKSSLPSVLRKRRGNFGKKGQSKYTHLTDQDTTDFNPTWKPDDSLREKMYARMAGLKGNNIMERKDLKKLKL